MCALIFVAPHLHCSLVEPLRELSQLSIQLFSRCILLQFVQLLHHSHGEGSLPQQLCHTEAAQARDEQCVVRLWPVTAHYLDCQACRANAAKTQGKVSALIFTDCLSVLPCLWSPTAFLQNINRIMIRE